MTLTNLENKLLSALDALQGSLESTHEPDAQNDENIYRLRLEHCEGAGYLLQKRIEDWKRSVTMDDVRKAVGEEGMKLLWWRDWRGMTHDLLDGRRSPLDVLVETKTLRVVLRLLRIDDGN